MSPSALKYHVNRAARKTNMERQELENLGRYFMWKAVQSYDGTGTLEGWIHTVLWRGFRTVLRDEGRYRRLLERAAEEVSPGHTYVDERIMLRDLVTSYRPFLSPLAYRVLRELLHPSKATRTEALADNTRRSRVLRVDGVKVGIDKVRPALQYVAKTLGVPLRQVRLAFTEIRKTVKKHPPHTM